MKQTLFLIVAFVVYNSTYADKVCSSIEIGNHNDLLNLNDCTRVLGHVRLSNFLFNGTVGNVALPLEDITDYLLIYRVDKLKTLGDIFPNLTVIRGHKLLFDKYSLVVYENQDIRNLGLKSLLNIRSGSIKVESNPVLCFANTVNWIYFLENPSVQHFSLKRNSELNECAFCLKNVTNPETEYLRASCWNLENFQRKKPIAPLKVCPTECGLSGCTTDLRCCSTLCLTGCFAENCRICKHFRTFRGTCIEACNIPFYTLADQCITENECRKNGLIPHAGSCISCCPRGFKQVIVNNLTQCNLLCNQNFTIRSRNDLEDIKGCVIIRGSLHIELKDETSNIIADLELALGGIKEISGSLKITKSPQLVSLGLFKKLDTIKGDELINKEVSLYVVNNLYLEEIWPDNHRVAILKGRIFFHLNPRLCFNKILQLAPSIRSYDQIRVRDASPNSNGERVICGENISKLHPIVEDYNATAVRTRLEPLHSSEKQVVLGYLYYYKEALVKNVTMYDGRHGCGQDNWKMDLSVGCNIRHVFLNLKPYTQYAYFVKTLTMVDYHMKKDWISAVQYFRTLQARPGPVMKMYSTALSATTIIVHWWPPRDANGIISEYLLRFEAMVQHINHSQVTGYDGGTFRKKCECGFQMNNRGPPADDLDYYSREKIVIDDAISNFVFVSSETIRRLEEERRLEDNTRRKRNAETPKESPNSIDTDGMQSRNNISSSEQNKIEYEKANELNFKKHLEEVEKKSLLEQDTGTAGFSIVPQQPICSISNPSLEYQKEQNCVALEHYKGIKIPAHMHSYTLDNLECNMAYKIYIQACVEGLENACGPEKSIEAMTLSKSIEHLLNGS